MILSTPTPKCGSTATGRPASTTSVSTCWSFLLDNSLWPTDLVTSFVDLSFAGTSCWPRSALLALAAHCPNSSTYFATTASITPFAFPGQLYFHSISLISPFLFPLPLSPFLVSKSVASFCAIDSKKRITFTPSCFISFPSDVIIWIFCFEADIVDLDLLWETFACLSPAQKNNYMQWKEKVVLSRVQEARTFVNKSKAIVKFLSLLSIFAFFLSLPLSPFYFICRHRHRHRRKCVERTDRGFATW